MFKVKMKYDNHVCYESFIVYHVKTNDDGSIEFLIFEFDKWQWVDANMYEPV